MVSGWTHNKRLVHSATHTCLKTPVLQEVLTRDFIPADESEQTWPPCFWTSTPAGGAGAGRAALPKWFWEWLQRRAGSRAHTRGGRGGSISFRRVSGKNRRRSYCIWLELLQLFTHLKSPSEEVTLPSPIEDSGLKRLGLPDSAWLVDPSSTLVVNMLWKTTVSLHVSSAFTFLSHKCDLCQQHKSHWGTSQLLLF